MPSTPAEVVKSILANPTDAEAIRALVAPDATYVSLSYDNPELKRLMPWAGTSRDGPQAIVDTYARVGRYWANEGFQVEDVMEDADRVAVFGRFTYRSTTLGKTVTSPFAIFARVRGGQVTYMQFMEDTFGTASTFRDGGQAVYRADPDGGTVVL